MVDTYRKYIEDISKRTGFISSTVEKVDRLINVLEWINNHETLGSLLVLKGGTAINIAIFDFPRLSVDIDLDLAKNFEKEELENVREYIMTNLCSYLKANGYEISKHKSKNTYALNSIVAEYKDVKGNLENIKIEINYMNRVHILDTMKMELTTSIYQDKKLEINIVNPIEIYAAKICALLDRIAARDLFDVYTLSKYDLFDVEEKKLLRECFMLEYLAINSYSLDELNIERIDKLSKQDIKTRLLPTLKDRNPRNSNVEEMKKSVKEYLKDILEIDDKVIEFENEFSKGIYKPELIFEDKEIIERIKEHPMIIWKLNKENK